MISRAKGVNEVDGQAEKKGKKEKRKKRWNGKDAL